MKTNKYSDIKKAEKISDLAENAYLAIKCLKEYSIAYYDFSDLPIVEECIVKMEEYMKKKREEYFEQLNSLANEN